MAEKRRVSRVVTDKDDRIRVDTRGKTTEFTRTPNRPPPKITPPRFRTQSRDSDDSTEQIFKRIILQPTDVRERASFANLIGVDDVRREIIKSLVIPVQFPDLFNDFTRPAKHTFLYGPPGTGKTEIASAIAVDVDAIFYNVKTKDTLTELGGGQQADRQKGLKRLFAHARAQEVPVVIFFDEIDGIMGKRGEPGEFNPDQGLKNEFLIQLDGITTKNDNIHIIGASNYPDRLDGGFISRVESIEVPLPDSEARLEMLQRWTKRLGRPIAPDFDWNLVVAETENNSGRGIERILRAASNLRWNEMVDGNYSTSEMIETIKSPEFKAPLTDTDVIEAIYSTAESIDPEMIESIEKFNNSRI